MDDNSLKVGSNEMELVDFRIFNNGEDGVYEGIHGINVSKVREIIRVPKLTELPGTPDFIEGIFAQPLTKARRRPRHGRAQWLEQKRRKDQTGIKRRISNNRF